MASSRRRYYLIDLVLVIVFCGLTFGSVRWVWGIVTKVRELSPLDGVSFPTFLVLEFAFIVWFLTWKFIRGKRTAPECVECGRRFQPPKKLKGPAICPRCHRRTLSPSGLKKEQARNLWTCLILLAVITGFVAFVLSDFVEARFGGSYWLALPFVAVGATLGLFVARAIVPSLTRYHQSNSLTEWSKSNRPTSADSPPRSTIA
jgi:hypothetical protein